MADFNNDFALDWESVISDDGKEHGAYTVLPEGDYPFTVQTLERATHPGSAKLPKCPKAVLNIGVQYNGSEIQVRANLFLCKSQEWKVTAFFRCLGMKTRGQEIKPDWNKVEGAKGTVHVKPVKRTGTDGVEREYNEVDYWIDSDAKPKKETNGFGGGW